MKDILTKTVIISIMIFGIVFAMANCDARRTESFQKTQQMYNELERCVGSCPAGWSVDKACVDRCLKMEEKRIELECKKTCLFADSDGCMTCKRSCPDRYQSR